MENNTIEKLDKIADIWNNFILEYKFCNNKIKFNDEIKTNYFGDILGYILYYTKNDIDIFTGKKESDFSEIELPIIPITRGLNKNEKDVSYHYELGKLSTKRNIHDFEFFSSLLKSKCDNCKVLIELNYMQENLNNDIEYYCAYKYLRYLLKN